MRPIIRLYEQQGLLSLIWLYSCLKDITHVANKEKEVSYRRRMGRGCPGLGSRNPRMEGLRAYNVQVNGQDPGF